MFNARTLVALVVAGSGLVTAVWLPTRHDTADASERNRRHGAHGDRREPARTPGDDLSWHDEFDAPAGTPADPARWRLDTTGARPYEAAHDGEGNLVVAAHREHSYRGDGHSDRDDATAHLVSAGIAPRQYGRVEVRLRTPRARDPRPALRILAGNLDEVTGTRLSPGLHTYALDFSPGLLVWRVDGVEYQRAETKSLDGEFWLVLSVAPGYGRRVLVDYVRVSEYGQPGTAEPSPVPPTSTPPTSTPPTSTPPTSAPPTSAPPTSAPPSSTPPTTAPTTTPPTTKPPAAKKWAPFKNYAAGQQVTYDATTYRVRQAHTSLPGWEPPAVPALFAAV